MKAILQGFYQKEHFWLRLGVVLLAVLGMGFALSLLLLVDMGTDPCSMMNKAISAKTGMSFGNWQALMNTVLLVLVVIFGGRNLGSGTLCTASSGKRKNRKSRIRRIIRRGKKCGSFRGDCTKFRREKIRAFLSVKK